MTSATEWIRSEPLDYYPKHHGWWWLQKNGSIGYEMGDAGFINCVIGARERVRIVFRNTFGQIPADKKIAAFQIFLNNIFAVDGKPKLGKLRFIVNGRELAAQSVVFGSADAPGVGYVDAWLTGDPRGQLVRRIGDNMIEIINDSSWPCKVTSIEFESKYD